MSAVPNLSRLLSACVALVVAWSVVSAAPAAAAEIVITPGQDIQAVINAQPPGSSFTIGTGTHREQSVVPRDGDRFIGQDGAILTGARVLGGWVQSGNTWSVGGQTQEGFVHGTVLPGFEGDRHPEDLWVDGVRLQHVLDRTRLAPDTWWFDYAADTIHIAVDPAGRKVETSTAPFAFAGAGVRDVRIENLTVTRYATPAQGGAIGGHYNDRDTRHWSLERITATDNHAYGIIVAPGMVVSRSRMVGNGQAGIGGSGTGQDGYVAPVEVTETEIAHNLTLGFDWWWEGGGTKFSLMAEMTFANNWVHHNAGPGVWFDVNNTGVTITDNLVEFNGAQGIFYEISSGGRIAGNIVRNNSTVGSGGFHAAGIDVSQSSSTLVEGNLVHDQTLGIIIRHDDNRREEGRTTNVTVRGNDISTPEDGLNGMIVENTAPTYAEQLWNRSGNRFTGNTIRVPRQGVAVLTWGTNYWPRVASWGFDDTITTEMTRGNPSSFVPVTYGAAGQSIPAPTAQHYGRG